MELATAGAARTLGYEHPCTVALAKAAQTMAKEDLWAARFELKKLRRDQRDAIAAAVESE